MRSLPFSHLEGLRTAASVTAAVAFFAAGCGNDDDNGVTPPVNKPVVLTAVIDTAQELPAPVGASGSGSGVFILNANRDEVAFEISFGGLTGPVTAAHLHRAPAGSTGAVVRGFLPQEISANTIVGTWKTTDTEALTSELVQALRNGELYVNIHTAANGPGEIRGQVLEAGTGSFFKATVDVAQEIPAPVGGSGSGTGFFMLNAAATDLTFRISFGGLSSAVTAAHFHRAPAGSTGAVVRGFTASEMGANTIAGVWSSMDSSPLTADLVQALRDGEIYVNIHTANNGPGEIRGQVLPIP